MLLEHEDELIKQPLSNWLDFIALKVKQGCESHTGRVKWAEAIDELQKTYGKIESSRTYISFKDKQAKSTIVTTQMRMKPTEMQEAIACYIASVTEQKTHQLW